MDAADENRTWRNLTLIGFMGTGKSTVGQIVARQLGFRLLDTDDLIERRVGRSVPEIFAEFGEARFRAEERTVVAELGRESEVVISAGGGLVTNDDCLAALKEHSLVICLWAGAETIWNRVRHHSHRPLLNVAEPYERICGLLNERAPYYRQADILLNTEQRSAREVAQLVLHHFRRTRRA